MTTAHQPVTCNLCGHRDGDVVADTQRTVRTPAGDFAFHVRLVCCEHCGLVYWTPRFTAEALERYYRAVFRSPIRPSRIDDWRRLAIRNRLDWLSAHVRPGALLEIGSAEGFFLQRAVEAGFHATGIEPSAVYAAVARTVAPTARIIESFGDHGESAGSFDVVCSFFVLEHSLDALEFLRRSHRSLRPGGRCVLEVPDVARYPEQTGDMLWHEHTYHFTRPVLERLLRRSGFELESFASPGPSYPFGMAVIAIRHEGTLPDWDRNLPDVAARHLAIEAFAAHATTVGAYRAALRSVLAPVLARTRDRGPKLAVYGTGAFHDQLIEVAGLDPATIVVAIDDNETKWGTETRHGVRIDPPSRLMAAHADAVIIASDAFEDAIGERIRDLAGRDCAIVRPHSAALALMRSSTRTTA